MAQPRSKKTTQRGPPPTYEESAAVSVLGVCDRCHLQGTKAECHWVGFCFCWKCYKELTNDNPGGFFEIPRGITTDGRYTFKFPNGWVGYAESVNENGNRVT